MREQNNFNKNWKFTKKDDGNNSEVKWNPSLWEPVSIPHTWNSIDGANGLDYYQGACWYRKEFFLDSRYEGKRIFLEFQAANSITDVYINGSHAGQHRGGYSCFRFDITELAEMGKSNLIAVKVDNSIVGDVYPQKADFTFYGGIYRDINLIVTDSTHFDMLDNGSSGVYLIQDKVSNENASLTLKALIRNDQSEENKIRLWADFLDRDGLCVASTSTEVVVPSGETTAVEIPVEIDHPELWNGLEDPYLYTMKVSLQKFNDTLDLLEIPIGLRFFEVDPDKGFYLNGEPYRLKGVARHQDRMEKGWAISEEDQNEDMELIKEIGANTIRLAHYQHSPYFYDLCDSEGMVLWAEIPFITQMSKTDRTGQNAKQQMAELVSQNFNHPSIFFWGIHNEIQIGGEGEDVLQVVKDLHEFIKEKDPTRLTTLANVFFVKDDSPFNYISDVVGINKYYGWYMGKMEDFADYLDGYHRVNPGRALCLAEYGADGIVEYHSETPKVRDYTEEYHALFHEKVWNILQTRPFLWASYVWNMFDFGANIRDEGGVKGRNNKGLVSYDRKIKKDAFYLYKAWWSKEPFVHIAGRRFVDRSSHSVTLKVYSNCGDVELKVNGKSLRAGAVEGKVFLFSDVVLHEGRNSIRALAESDRGIVSDCIVLNRVEEPNPAYIAPGTGVGDEVENWFDERADVSDVEVQELDIPEGVYSSKCTFGEIIENEETLAILHKYMGRIDSNSMFKMIVDMPIDTAASMDPDPEALKRVYAMNLELIKIRK